MSPKTGKEPRTKASRTGHGELDNVNHFHEKSARPSHLLDPLSFDPRERVCKGLPIPYWLVLCAKTSPFVRAYIFSGRAWFACLAFFPFFHKKFRCYIPGSHMQQAKQMHISSKSRFASLPYPLPSPSSAPEYKEYNSFFLPQKTWEKILATVTPSVDREGWYGPVIDTLFGAQESVQRYGWPGGSHFVPRHIPPLNFGHDQAFGTFAPRGLP